MFCEFWSVNMLIRCFSKYEKLSKNEKHMMQRRIIRTFIFSSIFTASSIPPSNYFPVLSVWNQIHGRWVSLYNGRSTFVCIRLCSPGPGFQVELETRFAAQAQKPWAWIIDISELEQQILSQAPLGNRVQDFLAYGPLTPIDLDYGPHGSQFFENCLELERHNSLWRLLLYSDSQFPM